VVYPSPRGGEGAADRIVISLKAGTYEFRVTAGRPASRGQ